MRPCRLKGKKFSRLTVIGYHYTDKNKQYCWLCRCKCGNEVIVPSGLLNRRSVKSCGCLAKEGNATKHGYRRKGKTHPLYRTWVNMRQRCYDKNHPAYKYYGARGIKVCKRWNNFPNFKKNMGYRPKQRTLDRINNNGNYTLLNCRWATWKQQARGRRKRGTAL